MTQKALNAGTYTNPIKLSGLLSAFGDNVSTDFSIKDAIALMGIVKNIGANNIKSIGLADPPNNFVTTDTVNNLSIVRPTAGIGIYTDIQNYVRNTLKDPYIAKENAPIDVLNGAGTPGLADPRRIAHPTSKPAARRIQRLRLSWDRTAVFDNSVISSPATAIMPSRCHRVSGGHPP